MNTSSSNKAFALHLNSHSEQIRRDDQHWFRARPHRNYRLRRPSAEEMAELVAPPKGLQTSVAVRQVKKGFRLKVAVVLSGTPATDEQTAKNYFGWGISEGGLRCLSEVAPLHRHTVLN